jgi:hypothetical protein
LGRFLVPFVINTSYLIERVKDGFSNLEDSSTEYVITEVVGTMFGSNSKPYPKIYGQRFCGLQYT